MTHIKTKAKIIRNMFPSVLIKQTHDFNKLFQLHKFYDMKV